MLRYLLLLVLVAHQTVPTFCEDYIENMVNCSNIVGNKIFQSLAKFDTHKNFVFSPLSYNIMLSLVNLGDGKTYWDMMSRCNLNLRVYQQSMGIKKILDVLKDENMDIYGRIYRNHSKSMNGQFSAIANAYFYINDFEINFKNQSGAKRIINDFIANATKNTLHEITDLIPIDTHYLLLSTAHYKGDWLYTFTKTFVGNYYFDGKTVPVKMMTESKYYSFGVFPFLGAKVVQIPFKDFQYSMLIILPINYNGLRDVEMKLNIGDMEMITQGLDTELLNVIMPEFYVGNTLDLKEATKSMGRIASIFNYTEGRSEMVYDNGTISNIYQATAISVNQYGVDVTTATETLLERSLLPPASKKIIVDHPFLFVIMRKNFVLFLGRVYKL